MIIGFYREVQSSPPDETFWWKLTTIWSLIL